MCDHALYLQDFFLNVQAKGTFLLAKNSNKTPSIHEYIKGFFEKCCCTLAIYPAARVVLPVFIHENFRSFFCFVFYHLPRRVMQLWLRGVLQPPHVICWHSAMWRVALLTKGMRPMWIFRSDFTAYGRGWDFFLFWFLGWFLFVVGAMVDKI